MRSQCTTTLCLLPSETFVASIILGDGMVVCSVRMSDHFYNTATILDAFLVQSSWPSVSVHCSWSNLLIAEIIRKAIYYMYICIETTARFACLIIRTQMKSVHCTAAKKHFWLYPKQQLYIGWQCTLHDLLCFGISFAIHQYTRRMFYYCLTCLLWYVYIL